MTIVDETAFMDATAQAELVRKKEVTPLELVEAAIARIENLNPELNAVVTPMFDLAREAAERLGRQAGATGRVAREQLLTAPVPSPAARYNATGVAGET